MEMMPMNSLRPIAAAAAMFLACAVSGPVRAETFTDAQRGEIEAILKDYLLKHPEIVQEAINELERRQDAEQAEKHRGAIKENAKLLYSSPRQVTLGNPNGNVTFVEFFDYNCGYCKHAMDDMLALLKTDTNLKVVLKEFPVLGPGSVEAAQVAVAVRMQDPTGKKYLEFHQKLLGGRGQADKAHALAAARDVGVDMARLEKDMTSAEVKASIAESMKLAETLGLNGTPSYVVGSDIVMGAVGLEALQQRIDKQRKCGEAGC
jgi:protein-disulfide isomerase